MKTLPEVAEIMRAALTEALVALGALNFQEPGHLAPSLEDQVEKSHNLALEALEEYRVFALMEQPKAESAAEIQARLGFTPRTECDSLRERLTALNGDYERASEVSAQRVTQIASLAAERDLLKAELEKVKKREAEGVETFDALLAIERKQSATLKRLLGDAIVLGPAPAEQTFTKAEIENALARSLGATNTVYVPFFWSALTTTEAGKPE